MALLTLRYTNVSRRTVISGTSFECNVSYMHKYIYTIHVVWVVLAQVYSKSNCCVEPPILPSYSYVNFGIAFSSFLSFAISSVLLYSALLFVHSLHTLLYFCLFFCVGPSAEEITSAILFGVLTLAKPRCLKLQLSK